ncbi:MAG TPA: radical SAM protein [Clostridia bacterium]
MDISFLKNCALCPRECHADRTAGKGYCKVGDRLVVARAALHMWEEPCISGEQGSGTVFFSGCSLGCVYCQNKSISKDLAGKEISIERLAEIFLELQDKGANNINLVTASHYVPYVIETLDIARAKGLNIPIVYNCGGYEKVQTLKLLEGYIDIYLPDLKYMSPEPAIKYSNCKDYFEAASKAIEEMVRQIPQARFDSLGIMQKGVIVRHLTLPGHLEDSKKIIKYLYETYGDKIYISIMSQYTPISINPKYPELNRKIAQKEYDELIDYAVNLGVQNGFIQEGDAAQESFIPEFNGEGV